MGEEDHIRASAASIIGADEQQLAAKGHPVPPPPPLGLAARAFLWMVGLFWIAYSIDRFAIGKVGQGFSSLVVGAAAVFLRYGILDGINRRRWENPQYRRLRMPDRNEQPRDKK